MFLFFLNAIEWLNPLAHVVGLGIAIWAFLRCRKRGYLIVGFYFAIVAFSLLAMPSIDRAIDARREPGISDQTQRKIDVAVQQAVDRVLEDEGHPILAAKETIRFPFGPIVLVIGFWLVARNEPRFN